MSGKVNRQILLERRPVGAPTPRDFALVESPAPAPREGELLCRTIYLSLDPWLRGQMAGLNPGQVVPSGSVSQVVESRHAGFAAGDFVRGANGWQEYAVSDGAGLRKLDPSEAPISYHLGLLGNTGQVGYFAVVGAGQPKAGETVVVSAAAGAVGSVAGQAARIAGCRVVGITSTQAKCDYLVKELGFDAAVSHRVPDVGAALAAACPKGIDVYIDNVGGPLLDEVVSRINLHARLVLVGAVVQYGAATPPPGPNLWSLVIHRATAIGFGGNEYDARAGEFRAQVSQWLKDGKMKYREDVVVGLENAPRAFIGLLEGENIGKRLVRVGEDPTRS